jgi:type IV secretory pathway protease TraF
VKAFQSAGDYFVLGDNRAKSCDSRSFGAIPGSLVVGKVVGIVWRHNQFDVHFL